MTTAAPPVTGLRLRTATRGGTWTAQVDTLVRRMVSPLCGIDQSIGFTTRGRYEPRFVVAGAHLTGVHLLLGQEDPGSYHLGGSGVFREEALIRTLGETVERYSGMVAPLDRRHSVRFATAQDMRDHGEPFIPLSDLDFFTAEQHEGEFPFDRPTEEAPLTWVRASSLYNGEPLWVPAQLLFIGYAPRRADKEPWIFPAVTTGSAAHTSPVKALRSGLLEIVQIDAAMGHWYSAATAPRIVLDGRVRALRSVLDTFVRRSRFQPRFHWLRAPGFDDVFNVACVMRGPDGSTPAAALGLGSDLRLEDSMYKALVEAAATIQFAKSLQVSPTLVGSRTTETHDTSAMYDLDGNVGYYARPANAGVVDRKFPPDETVEATALPPDRLGAPAEDTLHLLELFRKSEARLAFLDCTTTDIRQLGFHAARAWTPDLISLCLPSVPPLAHPRLAAYGGPQSIGPHPYP